MAFRPPVERLRSIPALVVTGSFHPAIDTVGAALAAQLGAQLVVFPERRHNVTLLPDRLNPLLERLWTTASGCEPDPSAIFSNRVQ